MKLYSVAEAAEILGLSEKSVRGAVGRGDLPASKVCGRVRIAKRDLRSWVEANRVMPPRNGGTPLGVSSGRGNKKSKGVFGEALERAET